MIAGQSPMNRRPTDRRVARPGRNGVGIVIGKKSHPVDAGRSVGTPRIFID
jgi:hypothetical protein